MTNLQKFCWYLDDLPSPRHFLKWNYYFSVSSILARKVWLTNIDDAPIFANLYLVVVAPPGVGKSLPAIMTKKMLATLKEIKVIPGTDKIDTVNLVNFLPDSLTVERLIESLASHVESIKVSDNPKKFYVHSSGTFYIVEELTGLFKTKQEDLIDFLTLGWNGGDFKRETKSGDRNTITQMCLNLFGCTTTDRLAQGINSNLISQGFTARTIFLYGHKAFHRKPGINPGADQRAAMEEVKKHWRSLGKLVGQVSQPPEVTEWINNWLVNGYSNKLNKDKKLEDYYGRKDHHLKKMAMVCHFAEKTTMTLEVEDFEIALKELELIEIDMHLALKSLGRNPIHTLAESIKHGLENNGGLSKKKILALYFDGGNADEIQQAIDHKLTIGEFKTHEADGIVIYTINRDEDNK